MKNLLKSNMGWWIIIAIAFIISGILSNWYDEALYVLFGTFVVAVLLIVYGIFWGVKNTAEEIKDKKE